MSSVKLDTGGLAITQVAAVVRDLRSSLEAYHKALGWGPWNVYEHKPPMLHSTELHGKPTEFTMLGAECHAGADRASSSFSRSRARASTRSGSTSTARACTTSP